MRRLSLLVVAVMANTGGVGGFAQTIPLRFQPRQAIASFTPLGDLPGAEFFSRATAVSGDGLTVVGYSRSNALYAGGTDEAFHWRDGQMVGLGAPPIFHPNEYQWRFSRATGVSNDGAYICGASNRWGDFPPVGALWVNEQLTSDNTWMIQTEFRKMANNGNYVAMSHDLGPWPASVLFTPPGSPNDFITYPSGSSSHAMYATHVSADGWTAVGYSVPIFGPSVQKAFRKRFGQPIEELGTLPGSTDCRASAVSGDGSIVLGYCMGMSGFQPFKWTQASGMVPSGIPFEPLAVSYDGSVAVRGASIWDAVNGTRNLKTLLSSFGIDMSAWSSLSAADISDDGMVVVGYGTRISGVDEAFRAVLPEPATVGLLLPVLLACRRRRSSGRSSARA